MSKAPTVRSEHTFTIEDWKQAAHDAVMRSAGMANQAARLARENHELLDLLQWALSGVDAECEDQEEGFGIDGQYWADCLTRGEPSPCRACRAKVALARAKGGEG